MATIEFTAFPRTSEGRGASRRMRRTGKAPGIVYGGTNPPQPIELDHNALIHALRNEVFHASILTMNVDGASTQVLLCDVQMHPFRNEVLHVDFLQIAMDKLLQVTIPIIVHGEPKGVKQQGGILEFIRREIVIEVLPADIPEHIDVDVTELMLHQGIRVRDVATNAKWKPVSDLDLMLVHVIMPKAEEVAAPADAAAAGTAAPAEPEVMKKGKKDEEEGDKKDDKKKEEKKK